MGNGWEGHSVCCDEDLAGNAKRQVEVVTFKNGILLNRTAVVTPAVKSTNTPFLQALNVPVVPTTADAAHVQRLTAEALNPANGTLTRRASISDLPAVCLPLISQNPVGNPYHPALVGGVANVNLRDGQGFPVPLGIGRKCEPPEVPPCETSWTLTRSWTSSLSYTVAKGGQQSITNTLGKTKTVGDENSAATSISDTLERSVSHTSTKERGGSSSDTVAKTLTKTTEISLANTHTSGTESSSTDTTNEEETNGLSNGGSLGSTLNFESGGSHTAGTENSHSHTTDNSHTSGTSDGTNSNHENHWEVGGGAGGSFLGISLGVQASGGGSDSSGSNHESSSSDTHSDQNTSTDGSSSSDTTNASLNFGMNSQRNWEATNSRSHGHSTAVTNGRSESDSQESRRSDSISDALTNSHTDEAHWSNSESDTIGNSESHTFGKTNTFTTSHTYSDEQTEAKAYVTTLENTQQQGVDLTQTLQQTWTSKINLHSCIVPVLYYNTKSLHVPWACKNYDNQTEIFSTEISTLDTSRASLSMGDMDCNVATVDFVINNPDFEGAATTGTTPAALASGQTLDVGKRLSAGTENEYSLSMEFDGQLTFKHYNDLLWTSDTGYLTGYSPRARITDDGHLIIEAKNIFSKMNYRMNNYTTVWSTTPKYLGGFTVGYKGNGYKLVVQSDTSSVLNNDQRKPDIVLYDSKGAPLWMAVNTKFRNHLGYKHPLNYLVPTDMITGPNLPAQDDIHNRIDPSIMFLSTNTLASRDTGCGIQLTSGQGLQSPNGRFKLFLDKKGNLVHKDGPRTMWESYTSDLWFATAPYFFRINAEGEAYIADSKGHRVWQSMNYFMSVNRPFKAQITDDGGFTIVDSTNAVVFDNSPLQKNVNLTFSALFTQPRIPCDSVCKDGCRPTVVQKMLSNSTFNGMPNSQLWDGETLLSPNGQNSLTSSNGTLTFTSPAVGGSKVFYAAPNPNAGSTLEVFRNGTLQFNGPTFEILFTTAGLYPSANSSYALAITDLGYLTLTDVNQNNAVVWSFPDATPPKDLTYTLISSKAALGKCISVGNTTDNAPMILYDCQADSPKQLFGQWKDMLVSKVDPTFCAGVVAGGNFQALVYRKCAISGTFDRNNQWVVDGSTIKWKKDQTMVIDDAGAGRHNGNAIDIYTANGSPAQQWAFGPPVYPTIPFDTLDYQVIVQKGNGKCLDQPLGTVAGGGMQIWDCSGSPNQLWARYQNYIINKGSHLCLGVDIVQDGARLKVRNCFPDDNNLWVWAGDNIKLSDDQTLYIDNAMWSLANGNIVQLAKATPNNTAQKWNFGVWGQKNDGIDSDALSSSAELLSPDGQTKFWINNGASGQMFVSRGPNTVGFPGTQKTDGAFSGPARFSINKWGALELFDSNGKVYHTVIGNAQGSVGPFHIRAENDGKLRLYDSVWKLINTLG
ncbi:hypothetical protein HDU86_007891 [Geranomyces michiganensis]|nr:hypothetical protein HDU86_007891 [Geranomyces michiganensis]